MAKSGKGSGAEEQIARLATIEEWGLTSVLKMPADVAIGMTLHGISVHPVYRYLQDRTMLFEVAVSPRLMTPHELLELSALVTGMARGADLRAEIINHDQNPKVEG
jgi:hypothetical protein